MRSEMYIQYSVYCSYWLLFKKHHAISSVSYFARTWPSPRQSCTILATWSNGTYIIWPLANITTGTDSVKLRLPIVASGDGGLLWRWPRLNHIYIRTIIHITTSVFLQGIENRIDIFFIHKLSWYSTYEYGDPLDICPLLPGSPSVNLQNTNWPIQHHR